MKKRKGGGEDSECGEEDQYGGGEGRDGRSEGRYRAGEEKEGEGEGRDGKGEGRDEGFESSLDEKTGLSVIRSRLDKEENTEVRKKKMMCIQISSRKFFNIKLMNYPLPPLLRFTKDFTI